MKTILYAILMYQICGNDIAYFKNTIPFATCNLVTRECTALNEIGLILLRETASCSRIKKFNVVE
jgi:hypothetical protein